MASPRVLVVDSDPSSLGLLTHGMNRFGLATDGARDASQAISLLSSNRPDVVVSDIDAGSGLKVLERIRQNPETRDVPVLLLAKGAWARRRTQARELGAQELVAKPAFVQDIAVLTWLYAGRSAHEECFEGNFGEPSCAALLRGLLAGGRSGTLRLDPSDAIVQFKDGAVVDATLPPLAGERALLRILTLGTGSYELSFGPLAIKPSMQFELSDLATRGLAHVKLWEQLKAEIQPLDQLLTVDFENLSSRVGALPRGLFALIRLFDGKRTIGDVIAASTLDDLTAGQAIAKLRALDIFEQGRRNKWEADTPSLGRPTPLEPVQEPAATPLAAAEVASTETASPAAAAPVAALEASDELPPLASTEAETSVELPGHDLAPVRLTPAMAFANDEVAHADFFSAQAEAIAAESLPATHELPGPESFESPSPLRVLGWALVGVMLVTVAVLFWRSTPGARHEAPTPTAVAAPAVAPAPIVQPAALSETAKKFDLLMSNGAIAYDKHDLKHALAAFEEARTLLPNEASAALAVGSAQYDLGRLDAATASLSKAVELEPQNGRAEILLGAIAQERGEKDVARDHYQNYLSIDPDGEHAGEVKALLRRLGR